MSGNPNLGMMRNFRRETHELITRGLRLSAEEISRIQAELAEGRGDRESRLALLGSRIVPAEVQASQVHWFAENEPWTSLGMHGVVTMAPGRTRERGSALWRRAVADHVDDARVIENAAWFFAMVDPVFGAELLEEHCSRRPSDPERWELLALFSDFVCSASPDRAHDSAVRSLEAAFRAFREESDGTRRLPLLGTMRAAASRAGLVDQLRLLDLSESANESGRTADRPSERKHYQEVALAFVALADGNDQRAVELLRGAAGYMVASEHLKKLADEVVTRAGRDVVRDLLATTQERCADVARKLEAWIKEL